MVLLGQKPQTKITILLPDRKSQGGSKHWVIIIRRYREGASDAPHRSRVNPISVGALNAPSLVSL